MTMRRAAARSRPLTKRQLEAELEDLSVRLAEAEQMLHAIQHDEVDALVVIARDQGKEEVRTLDRAYLPYEHLVNAVRDGVVTAAEDGTILHANARFAELVGREEVLGAQLLDLVDRPERLRTVLQNVAGQPVRFEAGLRRPDGALVAVEMSASLLPVAGVRRVGLVVVATGAIAERAKAPPPPPSQALLEAPDLASVLAHLPTGILLVDAKSGTIVYANRRAEEILGRALVGLERPLSHVELACWRADGSIVELDQLPGARVLRGEGEIQNEELIRERGDGSIVHTRTGAAPLYDSEGHLTSAVITIEDMTDEVLARADMEANERFRELFIAVLGHDLRDPLAAILTGTQLMLRRGGLKADQVALLERISRSTQRMARLTGEVMDFTRSRLGGGIKLDKKPVVMHDIVRAVVADLQPSYPNREIKIATSGAGAGEWDADRLTQVVWNLVVNALVHGADAPVDVRVTDQDGAVRLDVHNDGPPIPPDLLAVIFDPFRRAGDLKKGQGLGLGLYIAQQIVHAHGGTLTVDSHPERGTTFTAILGRSRGA